MARTPSLTVSEAESLIGPRPIGRVDANNRSLVRKWLSAHGFPYLFSGGLSVTELTLAYNTPDDFLPKLREKLARAEQEAHEAGEDQPVPVPAPRGDATPMPDDSKAAALQQLLELLGVSGGISEDRVRDIVRTELPSLIPVVRIEVTQGGEKRDLGEKRVHRAFKKCADVLDCNVSLMLVGPAGSGKSTIAEQVAETLGLRFYVEGAMDGAHKVTGFVDGHGRYQTTPFRQAFEHGGVYCWEEADNSDPSVSLVINNALANGHMTYPDSPNLVARHPDFRMVACANTYGRGADRVYVGRNQLDGATLDRFAFVDIDYDEALEKTIAGNDSWVARVQALRAAAQKEKARVIISPRASIFGAKLLAKNWSRSDVEDAVIWKGVDAELRRRIEQHAKG